MLWWEGFSKVRDGGKKERSGQECGHHGNLILVVNWTPNVFVRRKMTPRGGEDTAVTQ